jgi:hypothetical protein
MLPSGGTLRRAPGLALPRQGKAGALLSEGKKPNSNCQTEGSQQGFAPHRRKATRGS